MKKSIGIILSLLLLQGCASLTAGKHTLASLSEIDVDMDKGMVQKTMGKPNVVRVGKRMSDDKIYELHEYKLYDDGSVSTLSWFLLLPASLLGTDTFWLHYINSKLVFWGAEGDWRGAPKWFSLGYSAPVGEPLAVEQMPSKVTEPK